MVPRKSIGGASMSLFAVRQRIGQLNRLDSERADFEYLKKLYGELLNQIGLVVGTCKSTEFFFRARRENIESVSQVGHLGAPPDHLIRGFQRCNAPMRSMFYAASKRMTALMEVRPEVGDIVYLSQWMPNGPFPVNRIFEVDEGWELAEFRKNADRNQIVHVHLETLFTRRVHHTFSSDYKFTAAISEILTSKFPSNIEQKIAEDGFVALRYPSVFELSDGYNTAMPRSFAERRLSLLHVLKLKVRAFGADGVEVVVLDSAHSFQNGSIQWMGESACLPKRRLSNDAVPFRWQNGNWVLEVGEPNFSNEDVKELLAE